MIRGEFTKLMVGRATAAPTPAPPLHEMSRLVLVLIALPYVCRALEGRLTGALCRACGCHVKDTNRKPRMQSQSLLADESGGGDGDSGGTCSLDDLSAVALADLRGEQNSGLPRWAVAVAALRWPRGVALLVGALRLAIYHILPLVGLTLALLKDWQALRDGPVQKLAIAVLSREVLHVLFALAATVMCPVFLLALLVDQRREGRHGVLSRPEEYGHGRVEHLKLFIVLPVIVPKGIKAHE